MAWLLWRRSCFLDSSTPGGKRNDSGNCVRAEKFFRVDFQRARGEVELALKIFGERPPLDLRLFDWEARCDDDYVYIHDA
jgi:hypothetical protein